VHGLLGWLYLFAFCTLRLVGSGLQISASKSEDVDKIATAALISSIGLSPLLLATTGILHEARFHLRGNSGKKTGWFLVFLIHFFVATGIALIGVGSSTFKPTHTKSSDHTLAAVGMIILLHSWVAILVWAAFTYFARYKFLAPANYHIGLKLLYALFATLPFTLIRIVYSTIYVFSRSAALNPLTGKLGVRIGLILIPELITCLIFIFAGLTTIPDSVIESPGGGTSGGQRYGMKRMNGRERG